MNKIIRNIFALFLLFSFFTATMPQTVLAQTATTQKSTSSADLQKRLAKIEQKAEARRKELGIPGMSLAIVKDGKVILSKGYGYKNFEKQIPVTADTQFAIGSATKAFTALSVLMNKDAGKLSLDENPRKYLPYFKVNDAEINEKITVKNLLTHSSGLNRTDLGWITGKLTREEIIKVAGEAKPMAKLGEKFLYQNVMYAAAGEIVGKVNNTTWENYVAQNILKPLGMLNSSVTVAEMQKTKDYSFGYEYNSDTKQTELLPTRDLLPISPAGSINSSANDMTKWLEFVLNKGKIGGKRLVSEESFNEWTSPQMKVGGGMDYAMGWFVQDWNGKKVVQHGGNIDGFNSMVALLPEENLGFVMLTNVSASTLGNELMPIIWDGILSEEKSADQTLSADAAKVVGKYSFAQAGFDIDVKMQDGKLVAVVPGQPTYILENIEGRKYKLNGAPAGFFITFKDDSAYLEQPQGNFTLPKKGAETETKASESAKELIGKYQTPDEKSTIVIKDVDGKISLIVGNQPPYPLIEKEKDLFRSPLLPDTYSVKVRRTTESKIEGITLVQPEGEFPFNYAGKAEKNEPKITANDLMTKTIAALGGEENLRKINSRVTKFDINFVNQGVKGYGTTYEKAPNLKATKTTLTALGKEIATVEEYFDGIKGSEKTSFARDESYTGQRLEDVKYNADFYAFLNWKKSTKSAEVSGIEKVGNEDVYVLRIKPETANAVTYYISTKTFLPIKIVSLLVSSTSPQKIPIAQNISDYRKVDGIMIPFNVISENPGMGEVITSIKEVKHDVKITDKQFQP